MIDDLRSSEEAVRFRSASAMGHRKTAGPELEKAVLQALVDADPGIRTAALLAAGHLRNAAIEEFVKNGVDVAPRLEKAAKPRYPDDAFRNKIEGGVAVDLVIDVDGTVRYAAVHSSIPALDDAALECVRRWRFKPALKGGQPVPVFAQATVGFRIH